MSDKKMEEERRGMLIGGLITLGVGLFFLLSNLDILPNIGESFQTSTAAGKSRLLNLVTR